MAARSSVISDGASTRYEDHDHSPTRFGAGSGFNPHKDSGLNGGIAGVDGSKALQDKNHSLARPAGDAELAEGGEGEVDAVWGKLSEDGPKYRNLHWAGAAIIEIKIQVSRCIAFAVRQLDWRSGA